MARQNVLKAVQRQKLENLPVYTASFQPLGADVNDDRVVAEDWDILGQRWLFVAVCDGHGGNLTSEYTAQMLPPRLKMVFERVIRERFGGALDRNNVKQAEEFIKSMLRYEILKFDRSIGRALEKICPLPQDLDEQQARRLIREHEEIIERAFQGTTLSMAIVNLEHRFMWAAGVGDSTIGLSTVDADGKRHAERLCELHSFRNPREFYRVIMAHTSAEKDIVDRKNKLLGWLSMSRAIGDFPLKMDGAYARHLFRFLPADGYQSLADFAKRVVTPPYLTAEPSVRFVDLQAVWENDPVLLLYTDGVDDIVDGSLVFTPGVHSGADPLDVASSLLSETADPRVEAILGHRVEPLWSQEETRSNKAVDILGNLLGGTNAERLTMVMDEHLLTADTGQLFQIDDVSIVVAYLSR
ncbi:protein serine/threonine phosphatase 2C [Trametes cingulata]|nr:protein serine/threonine phosphatase 2C [Trametes cingulata]